MSSWTTASLDLRTLLSDGANDRYGYRKKCFGDSDGINVSFKTFDYRRVNDFTTAASPLGVYVSGVRILVAGVTSDDVLSGEFQLSLPPSPGAVVEATYYYQWFLDAELETFLTQAADWLGLAGNYANIPDGLRPAAKYYAAQEAMHKMAARWVERFSNQFLVEDAPDQRNIGVADTYRKLAEDYKKKSLELRDQYYTRQGQPLQPLFASNFGAVREVTPRR